MTKLCPRGKAAAKRKFKVYPSAYANAYASKICAGKIKDPSGVKRKDFRGRKPAAMGGPMSTEIGRQFKIQKMMGTGKPRKESLKPGVKRTRLEEGRPPKGRSKNKLRPKMMGGGLMEATQRLRRQGLKGGGVSQRGLGRAFMKGGRV